MQVWKFGGTSVGKPERMKSIRQLITEDGQPKVVVLSALSGTTNALLSITESVISNHIAEAEAKAVFLKEHYNTFIRELYQTEKGLNAGQEIINREFNYIKNLIETSPYANKEEKE